MGASELLRMDDATTADLADKFMGEDIDRILQVRCSPIHMCIHTYPHSHRRHRPHPVGALFTHTHVYIYMPTHTEDIDRILQVRCSPIHMCTHTYAHVARALIYETAPPYMKPIY